MVISTPETEIIIEEAAAAKDENKKSTNTKKNDIKCSTVDLYIFGSYWNGFSLFFFCCCWARRICDCSNSDFDRYMSRINEFSNDSTSFSLSKYEYIYPRTYRKNIYLLFNICCCCVYVYCFRVWQFLFRQFVWLTFRISFLADLLWYNDTAGIWHGEPIVYPEICDDKASVRYCSFFCVCAPRPISKLNQKYHDSQCNMIKEGKKTHQNYDWKSFCLSPCVCMWIYQ